MTKIKLSCGFEAELDETIIQADMELLDDLRAVDRGDGMALSRVTDQLLGEHKAALYDKLRDKTGKVPPGKVREALVEILKGFGGKNS